MNTVELAYEMSQYIDYIVGTQDCFSEKYLVARFYQAIWDLHNNTDMSPEEFAKQAPIRLKPISFYYRESYYGWLPIINKIFNTLPFPGLHTVMHYDNTGVVNNSNIIQLIDAVNNLSIFLLVGLQDHNISYDIKTAREKVRESGKCYPKTWRFGLGYIHQWLALEMISYNGFIDLYDFCENLRNNTNNTFLRYYCREVMEKMNNTILLINKTKDDSTHGLNIYFPPTKYFYNKYVLPGEIPCKYESIAFSKYTAWDELIKTYLDC
jgi:hypothetical protein